MRAHLGLAAVALRPGRGGAVRRRPRSTATRWSSPPGWSPAGCPASRRTCTRLRTLEDALALRATLDRIGSLLIVGAGFIGAEVATAARARGIAVTVLEALAVPPAPRARADGRGAGRPAVRPRPGSTCASACSWPASTEAPTGWRSGWPTGRGSRPTPGWWASGHAAAGLAGGAAPASTRARGCAATPAGGCAAGRGVGGRRRGGCGTTRGRRPRRHEHWTSAGDQAAVVARDILGAAPPPATVPYFWSDQFGLKIQLLGRAERADDRARAARRRAWTAGRCAARSSGTWRATGWWPSSGSAPRGWWRATGRWSPTARPAATCWRRRRELACRPGCRRAAQRNILRRTASGTSAPTAIRP